MSSCPLRLLSCPSWISSCPLRLPFWHLSWSSWFPPLWYRLPSALSLNCPLHCRLPCRFFLLVSRRPRWRSLLSFSSWISSCPLRLLSCPSWISRPFRLPFWHLSWSSRFPYPGYRLPSALSLNRPRHCLPSRFFLVSRRPRRRSLLSFSSWISSCPLRLLSCPSWISSCPLRQC